MTERRVVIVGEKRPELFIPDTDGRIVPRVPGAKNAAFTRDEEEDVD